MHLRTTPQAEGPIEVPDGPTQGGERFGQKWRFRVADTWHDGGQGRPQMSVSTGGDLDRDVAAIGREDEPARAVALGQCDTSRDRRVAAERDLCGRT